MDVTEIANKDALITRAFDDFERNGSAIQLEEFFTGCDDVINFVYIKYMERRKRVTCLLQECFIQSKKLSRSDLEIEFNTQLYALLTEKVFRYLNKTIIRTNPNVANNSERRDQLHEICITLMEMFVSTCFDFVQPPNSFVLNSGPKHKFGSPVLVCNINWSEVKEKHLFESYLTEHAIMGVSLAPKRSLTTEEVNALLPETALRTSDEKVGVPVREDWRTRKGVLKDITGRNKSTLGSKMTKMDPNQSNDFPGLLVARFDAKKFGFSDKEIKKAKQEASSKTDRREENTDEVGRQHFYLIFSFPFDKSFECTRDRHMSNLSGVSYCVSTEAVLLTHSNQTPLSDAYLCWVNAFGGLEANTSVDHFVRKVLIPRFDSVLLNSYHKLSEQERPSEPLLLSDDQKESVLSIVTTMIESSTDEDQYPAAKSAFCLTVDMIARMKIDILKTGDDKDKKIWIWFKHICELFTIRDDYDKKKDRAELIRKNVAMWHNGLIWGFITREETQNLLIHYPIGTFIVRFNTSCVGGATSIAFVKSQTDGHPKVSLMETSRNGVQYGIAELVGHLSGPCRPLAQVIQHITNCMTNMYEYAAIPAASFYRFKIPVEVVQNYYSVDDCMERGIQDLTINQSPATTFSDRSLMSPTGSNLGSVASPGIQQVTSPGAIPCIYNIFMDSVGPMGDLGTMGTLEDLGTVGNLEDELLDLGELGPYGQDMESQSLNATDF